MKTTSLTSKETEQPIMFTNHFTLLANLNKDQAYEVSQRSNNEWSSSAKSIKKTSNVPREGNKIPSIINARVTNGDIKKPSET